MDVDVHTTLKRIESRNNEKDIFENSSNLHRVYMRYKELIESHKKDMLINKIDNFEAINNTHNTIYNYLQDYVLIKTN